VEITPPIKIIQKYFTYLNEKQWNVVPSLWVEEQKQSLEDFLNNKENQKLKHGLYNIKKAKLIRWKEIPYEYGQNYLGNRYMEKFQQPRVFYVAVDYEVHKQDQYFIDGINYFLVALAKENGKWRIVLTPHVPVRSLITDGYGFGTEDEKTFDERRQKFLNGASH
jgi:hypothetical protein